MKRVHLLLAILIATIFTIVVVGYRGSQRGDMQSLFEYSQCRELESAIGDALKHFKIDPTAVVEFASRQAKANGEIGTPDSSEGLVWLVSQSSERDYDGDGNDDGFYLFDKGQLKDLDGDGWLECYTKWNKKFDIDNKGHVYLHK